MREFAWHHLPGQSSTERNALTGHCGEIYYVEFSPRGDLFASTGKDGAVFIGSTVKWKMVQKIDASPKEVNVAAFLPDGQTIAFLSSVPEKSHPKIWLAPSSGGAASRLAADGVDLIPGALRWAESGKALYFETGFKGTSQLFRVDLAARKATAVTSGDRTVHLVDVNEKTNRLVYAANDPMHLDDLYVADLDGRNQKPLTFLNTALWQQLKL